MKKYYRITYSIKNNTRDSNRRLLLILSCKAPGNTGNLSFYGGLYIFPVEGIGRYNHYYPNALADLLYSIFN